ncbi:MAG: NACHT domain-containing protein [Deltaproteobacteria bacterium]|nr:NACHT domain-containing protein [Deltaproteobacteria bacterium]
MSDSSGEHPRLVYVVGGPGSGKSTLATMLAADLAGDPLLQPLLIRLRDVSPERDVFDEITRVLREMPLPDGVGAGLAQVFSRAPRLVLLLDGYDELIQASRTGLGSFFLRLQNLLRDQRVQGIVCFGRDTVFSRDDTSIPEDATVVSLLPFDDAQVAQWCERWSEATGRSFDWKQRGKRAEGSDDEVLQSLIHEPLTLRLLALLDLEGIPIFSEDGGLDLARVYRHVISETCARHQKERGLHGGGPSAPAPGHRICRDAERSGGDPSGRSPEDADRARATDRDRQDRIEGDPVDPRHLATAKRRGRACLGISAQVVGGVPRRGVSLGRDRGHGRPGEGRVWRDDVQADEQRALPTMDRALRGRSGARGG